MNFTLPKNRTVPIILFAVISIVGSLMLGLYQLNKIAQYSYKEKLNTYDSLTENVVSIVNQEITNTYQSLQDAATLMAKSHNLKKEEIEELLPVLAQNKAYLDLAIVDTRGMGYDLAGNSVDASSQSCFIKARQGELSVSENLIDTPENEPAIMIAVPIIDQEVNQGVLLAYINAKIEKFTPLKSELEQGSRIYILNENKELIFYFQDTDLSEFDYKSVIAEGILREEAEKELPSISFWDFYGSNEKKEVSYLWEEEQLGQNHWSLLIGRVNNITPFSQGVLRITNSYWIFIFVGIFLLFLLIIGIQRRSNYKIIKMLYLDPVTGGDNWYRFRITANKILSSKQLDKRKFAMINFDITRFKVINDIYGYQKGDEVLKEIYLVVRRWSRLGEPLTRYAADQFYIFMSFQEEEEITQRINELNARLHQLHYIAAARITYGVYMITEESDSVDRMGQFASIAKNNCKHSTEGLISFFDDSARDKLLYEENIEKTMNDALLNHEFEVYLQPKYTAVGERISGAEALVRWFNKDGDMISPGFFIPVFEKNGFIKKLDYYMLKKVCSLIREWLDQGYEPIPISVNISRLHFANPQLAQIICGIVDDYRIPHNLIELELTESAFLQNKQTLIETVILLRNYGFLVSMDDFGAGYSSLNSLKDLPLDVVKLDGELFRMTSEVERGLTVIRNTITMAKDLHMKVVAECIETREQVEYLCAVGCDMIQGYYFAKPMPAKQFEERYFIA